MNDSSHVKNRPSATLDMINRDWLAQHVRALIKCDEEIAPDENLILYGLDSLTMMKLVAQLGQIGVTLSVAELTKNLTLAGWWRLIEGRLPG